MKKLNATLEKLANKIRKSAIDLNKMIARFETLKAKELKVTKQKKSAKTKKTKRVIHRKRK